MMAYNVTAVLSHYGKSYCF